MGDPLHLQNNLLRILDDWQEQSSNFTSFNVTNAPSMAPSVIISSGSNSFRNFGYLILALVLAAAGFYGWRARRNCLVRREKYMMAIRNEQADRVLGDMQMVPNDDFDNEML